MLKTGACALSARGGAERFKETGGEREKEIERELNLRGRGQVFLQGPGTRRRKRKMDVTALRQQYRMCRDKQRAELHLLRTGSFDLLDVVSIVPVAQGWMSSRQPARPSPPDPKTSDPWRVHLDLHRRHPAVAMETEQSRSRCSPSSSSQAPPTDTHTAGSGSARSRGSFTRRCASVDQNQDHDQNQNQNPGGESKALLNRYPFPCRRTLRISEAARRLGLYPSS
ncbi:uncharacterized protein C9orf152-like [Gambusia affinis]|uniref:uncharacterized protein C9orf152-like n=1 Tax=Gambusia affinis TaxID=33528 RepID=UPI001CDC11C1|nr:uncharacterized protein C9orf152-like [Gambusia affinis]